MFTRRTPPTEAQSQTRRLMDRINELKEENKRLRVDLAIASIRSVAEVRKDLDRAATVVSVSVAADDVELVLAKYPKAPLKTRMYQQLDELLDSCLPGGR